MFYSSTKLRLNQKKGPEPCSIFKITPTNFTTLKLELINSKETRINKNSEQYVSQNILYNLTKFAYFFE